MRIGVVTTSYPRAPGDPAGGFVAGHVAALRARGHEVEVIAAGDASTRADDRDDDGVTRLRDTRLFYRGGAPDQLERAPLRSAAAAAAFTARLTAAVRARAARWELIVAHWLAPSALAALAAPPRRAPLVAIAHGGDVHTLARLGVLAPVLHALRRRGARLVFVSEALRARAIAAAPRLAGWLGDALVQPMGVARAHFAGLGRAPASPPELLVAARLVALKGVDVAIDALAHVATAGARLVIAGDGPERAALELRARRLGARVHFLGGVDTVTRDRLLRACSAVVIPSRVTPTGRTEGAPLIAVEALAAGVPVIASRVGGLGELSAVRLVAPDDPRGLARAIDRTLAAPPPPDQLRRAVHHLDWAEVCTRLLRNE